MSSVLTYGAAFEADCQITKMGTFTSKGGGLMIQVQLPLDASLAGVIAMHLGNIAKIRMEFSSAKLASNGPASRLEQGELFGGPTAEPAPDETHHAGGETIASTCPACGGVAYMGEDAEDACETCGGTGVVYSAPGPALAMVPCDLCSGTGNLTDPTGVVGPCHVCHGTGKLELEVSEDPVGDAVEDWDDGTYPEDDQAVEAEKEPALV
ncbi:MAG: hypothetical protein WCG80_16980 [Spirochaetales bacterium]